MSIELGALLFEGVKKVVFAAISKRVVLTGENFLTRRKVESRIDDSIAQVIEQLLPFFENERLSDQKRQVLISNCTYELSEIVEDPQELFAASLDGQKVFDRRYEKGQLPQGIRDEGLGDLYALVFPQIANLICAYPKAIEQWKIEGYRDGFRRLDEIASTLGGVANKLDQLASKDAQTADVLLNRVRQSLTQRVEFQLDLTGLRGDRPDAVPLERCFVVPELSRIVEERRSREKKEQRIGEKSEILAAFSGPSRRAVVIGSPGAGKSTWSRWLQRQQLTNDEDRLAILVRLRDLIKESILPSQQSLIREAAGTHLREEVDSNVARNWCKSGVVTFILDGFDEVPPSRRDSVLSWISELENTTEKAGLILTSRPLTTDHLQQLSKKWLRWELLAFDQPRITEYISKWYAHAPLLADKQREVNAEELSRKWVKDFALTPLVGTPLMLATIVMVHHMDGELPRGRAKLYERYIDGMLGLWDSRWGVPSAIELSIDLKRRILTRLAVHLHTEGMEQIGDGEIHSLVQAILPRVGCVHLAPEVLDHLRERTGLLAGPGTWSFVHKNVGEFLVAAAIRDGDFEVNNGQKLDRLHLFAERHNDRWNNVLFFWAGLTTPGDLHSFIEQVVAKPKAVDAILGLSLIYDQLQPHRLTEPWRTKQLLKLFQRNFRTADAGNGAFVCGPLPPDVKFRVETFVARLRLPESTTLRTVLWECLRACDISWKKAAKCHPSLLFIMWSFFTTHPPNLKSLHDALADKTLQKKVRSEWLIFSATWGLTYAALGLGNVSLEEFVATLREACPEINNRLPFFVLGSFLKVIDDRRRNGNKPLNDLLLALESVKTMDIDQLWLKLSTEFEDSYKTLTRFDLFESFLHVLDSGELQGVASGAVSNARDYVTNLIAMRKRI
ncbi:MAG TPA: NACHT domain-containing protein [Pyrinomonadaceae bacterium]|nr:NACHT domain-containing protein [Pyrinomonadaceae bacterium]